MRLIAGVDVGGANTKITIIEADKNQLVNSNSLSFYFPFWKKPLSDFPNLFSKNLGKLSSKLPDYFAATMTAELADVFPTKRDGVLKIIDLLSSIIPADKLFFYTVDDTFLKYEQALNNPLQLAASNWVATGSFFAKLFPTCLIIDMGSTTTDLIIVREGEVYSKGANDLKRLLNGELYYTGLLRTPICAVANTILFHGRKCSLAGELFSIMADVHLILGNISEKQYTCETPDNRPATVKAAYNRLSRMLCCDVEQLSESELIKLAKRIERTQFNTIRKAVNKILKSKSWLVENPVILTGIGRKWLYKMFKTDSTSLNIKLSDEVIGDSASDLTPAYAVAYLLNTRLG